MKRKDFIRKAGLAAAGSFVVPYILPSGRLFAATGSRKVNHVVFCLFAGGVRNIESMQKAEGNLMPNMLTGNESISSDILPGMTPLPSPAGTRLQTLGTLFKDFRYASGPTGHYNGHTTAITGKYTDGAIQLKQPPKNPTIFEYYRKHNSSSNSALNTWWVSDSLGPYPYLNYSDYPGYGAAYGGNMIQPMTIFNPSTNGVIANPINLTQTEKQRCDLMRAFADGQFQAPSEALSSGIVNSPADAERLQTFLRTMISDVAAGVYNNPWGVGMNNDMINLFFGSKIIQEFKPELMVINMQGVDIGHFEFTKYVNNMRLADFALYKLWETIQSTPGMADDTILIVAPEHGRNLDSNSVIDIYGRYALDHNNDEMSRKIFCLIAGPSGVVKQGQVFNNTQGESVDIVPTIANILGFDTEMPFGATDGRVLSEAFN